MQEEGGAALSAPVRRRTGLIALLALLTATVDQVTKVWALAALTPGDPVDLIGRWFRLNLIHNPGAAFSVGDGATWALTALAIGIVIVGARFARTVTSRSWALGLGLVLGGAVGNLVDRLVRDPGPFRGHVVDFLDYGGLFVGNVADIAIVGGAAWIGLLAVRSVPASALDPEEQS